MPLNPVLLGRYGNGDFLIIVLIFIFRVRGREGE